MIDGRGLHTGANARVRLLPEPGPVKLRVAGASATLEELTFDGAARSTGATFADRRARVGTVEHLFAALGGLSIHAGVAIEIEGPEVPLVDGGGGAFVDALDRLDLGRPRPPSLVVAREGIVEIGQSRYELVPSEGVSLSVEIDFADPRLTRRAAWDGDQADFRARIAPARTFGFAREVEELAARGLANHVDPESVVVIADERILSAGRPFTADEPARHKLLDLIGDLYAHGGPPIGTIRATRPGHAATHEAVRRALAGGLLVRTTAGKPAIHP